MALDVDVILDRRQLRKKLSFWRIGAFVTLALLFIALAAASGLFDGVASKQPHIARVAINGVITEDKRLIQMLERIAKDDNVKGMILTINSPGGTTVGGEAIFEAVRKVAEKKPTAASVGTLAASAGYMIASASDHIVARRSSIVGSIGVIFQYPQAVELLDKIGVQVKEIKSSPLKAEPSPFQKTPPEAEAAIKDLIDDSYAWFVDLVTERRPLDRAEVLKLADGRIYSGQRGLDTKLVDALGGESVAREWLTKERKLDKDLKTIDWKPRRPQRNLLLSTSAGRWIAAKLGIPEPTLSVNDVPAVVPKRLFLDGLLSIWQ